MTLPQPSGGGPGFTFTYRALGPFNDPIWSSYLSSAAAVGQAVKTRILLLLGEWWENVLDGTPLWQKILGVSGPGGNTTLQEQISLIIQQRILGTPYVTGISDLQITFNAPARAFGLYAVIQTAFGVTTVQYAPTPSGQNIP